MIYSNSSPQDGDNIKQCGSCNNYDAIHQCCSVWRIKILVPKPKVEYKNKNIIDRPNSMKEVQADMPACSAYIPRQKNYCYKTE